MRRRAFGCLFGLDAGERALEPAGGRGGSEPGTAAINIMRTIPEETVEKTWARFSEASPEEIKQWFEQLGKEQPFIMAYVLAVEENLFPPDQRGTLLFLTLVCKEVLATVQPSLPLVSGEALEAAEEVNLRFLENLEAGPEMDLAGAVCNLVGTYNQMPLLGTVLEALMEGNEEEPELADENLGMALLHLKTVIDCLDRETTVEGSGRG